MDLAYIDKIPLDDFQQRRTTLFEQMADNSALILFSAKEQQRNADSTYPFRQDSYFWYLTAFNEPDSALLLIKKSGREEVILFLRPNDPLMETWNGRRLGLEKAWLQLKIDSSVDINEIDTILPDLINQTETLYYAYEQQTWGDKIVNQTLHKLRHSRQQNTPPLLADWRPMLNEMRLFKSENEARIMQRAGEISALGHIRAMQQSRVNRFEYELESEILHEFARHGARFASYNSIVASGDNACILHYTENNKAMQDGDLVLIDAGCEFAMYAGDITRTFPVNGKFSDAQKAIYDIVLKAQKRAIELLVPGNTIKQANDEVVRIKLTGLLELGIIKGDLETLIHHQIHRQFYMHGLGHWLGLDVHDVGDYGIERNRPLEPGMVLTVEPGLYLAENGHIPQIYHGIGVRIEDNLLITPEGNKILTSSVPKEVDEIEALMQQKRAENYQE